MSGISPEPSASGNISGSKNQSDKSKSGRERSRREHGRLDEGNSTMPPLEASRAGVEHDGTGTLNKAGRRHVRDTTSGAEIDVEGSSSSRREVPPGTISSIPRLGSSPLCPDSPRCFLDIHCINLVVLRVIFLP